LCFVFTARNIISPDAVDTAFVCQFFDILFDSWNGSFDRIVDGKKYRTAVKKIRHTMSYGIKVSKS